MKIVNHGSANYETIRKNKKVSETPCSYFAQNLHCLLEKSNKKDTIEVKFRPKIKFWSVNFGKILISFFEMGKNANLISRKGLTNFRAL